MRNQVLILTILMLSHSALGQNYGIRTGPPQPRAVTDGEGIPHAAWAIPILITSENGMGAAGPPVKSTQFALEYESAELAFHSIEIGQDAPNVSQWRHFELVNPPELLPPENTNFDQALLVRLWAGFCAPQENSNPNCRTITGTDQEIAKVIFRRIDPLSPTAQVEFAVQNKKTYFVVLDPAALCVGPLVSQPLAIKIPAVQREGGDALFPVIVSSSFKTQHVQLAVVYDDRALAFSQDHLQIGRGLDSRDFLVRMVSIFSVPEPSWANRGVVVTITSPSEQNFSGANTEVAVLRFAVLDTTRVPAISLDLDCSSTFLRVADLNGATVQKCFPVHDESPPVTVDTRPVTPVPDAFELFQSYPNPMSSSASRFSGTTIRFALPRPELVSIKVYDFLGRNVKTLVQQRMPAGLHHTVWNGSSESGQRVVSGIYFVKLEAADFVRVRRLLLLK